MENRRGYSLLETIVTLTVLAISFIGIFQCLKSALKFNSYVERRLLLSLKFDNFSSYLMGKKYSRLKLGEHHSDEKSYIAEWIVKESWGGLKTIKLKLKGTKFSVSGTLIRSKFF